MTTTAVSSPPATDDSAISPGAHRPATTSYPTFPPPSSADRTSRPATRTPTTTADPASTPPSTAARTSSCVSQPLTKTADTAFPPHPPPLVGGPRRRRVGARARPSHRRQRAYPPCPRCAIRADACAAQRHVRTGERATRRCGASQGKLHPIPERKKSAFTTGPKTRGHIRASPSLPPRPQLHHAATAASPTAFTTDIALAKRRTCRREAALTPPRRRAAAPPPRRRRQT